jgi:superfamily II RNA helicase
MSATPPLLDDPSNLSALRAKGADPDELFASFAAWAEASGTTLYPAQEEALIELVSGANVVLATPTGSGKSLVAIGALYAALAADRRSYYTAPIKALVSEKFFALCDVFGAANVGMLTGDASVSVTTTSSPGRHCADSVCDRSKVSAVMLRPKSTSSGSALSRSLSA